MDWISGRQQRPVTHCDVVEIFGRAFLKVQSGDRAVKGFGATGLYSVRRDIFKEEDFLEAEENITENIEIAENEEEISK